MSRSQKTSERESLESMLDNLARRPMFEIQGASRTDIKKRAYNLSEFDCKQLSAGNVLQLSTCVFDDDPYRLDKQFLDWIMPILTPAAAYTIAAVAIRAGDKSAFRSMLTIGPSVEVEPYTEQFQRLYLHASDWMESNPSLIHAALSGSKVTYALEVLQYQFTRREQASMTFHQFALNEIKRLINQSVIKLADQNIGTSIRNSIDVLALAIAIDGLPQTMEYIIHEPAQHLADKAIQQCESTGISLSAETLAGIKHDARLSVEREPKYALPVNLQRVLVRVIQAGEIDCVKRILNMPELHTVTIKYMHDDPYFWATFTNKIDILAELLKSCRLNPNIRLLEEAQEQGDQEEIVGNCYCLGDAISSRDAEMVGLILSSGRIELHNVVNRLEVMQLFLNENELNDDDRRIRDMLRGYIERRSHALAPAISQIQQFWQRHHKSTAIDTQDNKENTNVTITNNI